MVCKDPATVDLIQVSESARDRYLKQSEQSSISFLLSALNICNQCDIQYKASKNQRLHVELALMKMAKLPQAISLAVLAQEDIKKKV
jgi:DNA polymerase III subunit gamma/tau